MGTVSSGFSKKTANLVEVPAIGGAAAPADALTYEPFFGLHEKPFSLSAEPRFIFDSPGYDAARRGLVGGIRRREGLLVLTGEIGTGKTTLCRSVLRDLGRATYSSLVADPFASREDLLKMLLVDFGVLSVADLTGGSLRQASRTELGYLLQQFLESLPRDAFAVLILDEAQNLSVPLIEETRILFDTFGARGRLQIVFVGQPELHAKLKLPEMRQVDQRVCGYHRLGPMNLEAVNGYIEHRLHAAGGGRDRVLFAASLVDAINRRSGGVPRLINRICDRALQLAFERQANAVTKEILDAALNDVGAATLSPTWDAIVFADSTPAREPVAAPETPEPSKLLDDEDDFQKQIDVWVARDLAPAARVPASTRSATEAAPLTRQATPRASDSPRQSAARTVTTEWPRNIRPETYMQRCQRLVIRVAAIGIAVLAIVNLGVVGAAFLMSEETPADAAQVPAVAALEAAPEASAEPLTSTEPATPATIGAPVQAEATFLVSVGLFATRERADALVDALTQQGLPAMQRPYVLRQKEVQQVVLGPFFDRNDAAGDLARLKALGGYEDAAIVEDAAGASPR